MNIPVVIFESFAGLSNLGALIAGGRADLVFVHTRAKEDDRLGLPAGHLVVSLDALYLHVVQFKTVGVAARHSRLHRVHRCVLVV